MIPPALQWVYAFADLIGAATLEGLRGWDVRDEADPLRKVVRLRFVRPLTQEVVVPVRNLLSGWAESNNCVYKRSEWKDREFRALIMLKGLRPESNNDPFRREEDDWNKRLRDHDRRSR